MEKGDWKRPKNFGKEQTDCHKGGALVILNKSEYLVELNRLVGDTATYEKLKDNPTDKYKTKLKWLVKRAKHEGIVNKDGARYVVPDGPRVPVIYQLPKVHKNPSKPPERPIVSGVDSLFARIREYLDRFFHPSAQKCPVYLKDSKDLMESLQGIEVDEEHILANIDVSSLYTNIQQQHALKAVEWALASTNIKKKQKDFLIQSLDL